MEISQDMEIILNIEAKHHTILHRTITGKKKIYIYIVKEDVIYNAQSCNNLSRVGNTIIAVEV